MVLFAEAIENFSINKEEDEKKRSRIKSNIYTELYSLKDYEDNKSLFFESLKQNKN